MKLEIALAADVTHTQAFKNWFKQSKCTKGSKPRVLYHSTAAKFSEFSHVYTTGQMGFHLGTARQAQHISAIIRNSGKRSRLLKVYASIQNPLRLDDQGGWQGYGVQDMVAAALGRKIIGSGRDSTLRNLIIAAGYDGVVYENKFEGKGDSFIAFYPNQIKLVTNTTFDPSSNDISE